MGMPQIPEGVHRPKGDQLVIDMLEAVALEEMATAHLMNAQGEKMQAIIRQFSCRQIGHQEMEEGCLAVQDMLNTLIMNQWLLFNKMSMAIHFKNNFQVELPPKPEEPPQVTPVVAPDDRYETCKPCCP